MNHNLVHHPLILLCGKNTFSNVPGVVQVPDGRSLLPHELPNRWVAISHYGSNVQPLRLKKMKASFKALPLHSLAVSDLITLK